MLYLITAILFSSMLSIIMRISEKYISGNVAMLAANYITCTTVALLDTGAKNIFTTENGIATAAFLGIIGGFAYLTSFLLLQYNISKNGVVLPATFMKLGLLVPTVAAVAVFHEIPTVFQIFGFIIAITAIILINSDKSEHRKSQKLKIGLLLGLMLLAGIGDATSKFHEELGNPKLNDTFLLFIFGTACLLCIVVMIYKKQRIGKWEVLFGAAIGVPNYLSSKFLLLSLNHLLAVVAFPSFCVGCIVVVTLAGVFLFKEKLSQRQWIALAMIAAALAMLNM